MRKLRPQEQRQNHDHTCMALLKQMPQDSQCNQVQFSVVIKLCIFQTLQRPEVLQGGFLADYSAMRQLFVFFLPKMCSPGAQQVLFKAMTESAYAKGRQLKVMGYSIEDEVCSRESQHSFAQLDCP